ncbi:sulfite exporter TauE/SafE family protein [Candidatus Pacearchaeota archaeon]|nr:sulfite exporter TauE/SafE family protein [Candidatus Pacearchaeota archaeon]
MKKTYKIKGMHCNSCAMLIEREFQNQVNEISASYSKENVEIDFDSEKISEKEIKERLEKLGYEVRYNVEEEETKEIPDKIKNKTIYHKINQKEKEDAKEEKTEHALIKAYKQTPSGNKLGLLMLIASVGLLIFILYFFLLRHISMPEMTVQDLGDNASIFLLFLVGILTGFHCISMCGGFVVSYTSKNAINGHKSFKQHLVYGGSKVLSYAIIGGIFGLIGGFIAFSTSLRGYVAIFAGIFMIFYALSMFGLKFFRKFQFNPKFLTKFTLKAGQNAKGPYKGPFVTGLLNGLFIACGPLQAMYLYAAGTGSFIKGSTSLAVFGLGTLPIMLGFGSLATVISHGTTKKILKFSAIVVLILGLIMINRGLSLTGNNYNFDSIKEKISGTNINPDTSGVIIENGYQIVNMDVSGSGYSPNSFVLKKGVPVKWNVNVKQLTGCNSELILNQYNINKQLKQGLNVIEFTPDKEGTIPFSCGMGMLRGSFIVTESGTANQAQVKAAIPKAGSTCNMGANGGGCGGGSCGGSSGGGCGCGGGAR